MRTPTTLGRYALREQLAAGGMGVVYRGWDPQVQREVALKLLHGQGLIHPTLRQRLAREVQALRALDHPGIVRYLDAGEEGAVPYLVMELLAGRSLARRLEQEGRLPLRSAVEAARDLAAALAYAHARGVLHRDVKPDNVIETTEGRQVLVDFGLARLLVEELAPAERLSRTGQMLGTPGYWAPEQALGEHGAAAPAADVHGLGATLYALLLAKTPYEGLGLMEMFDAQARGPESPRRERPEIDPELDALILRTLARDPTARPSASEVEAELSAWLARGERGARRRGAGVVALVLLAGAAGVGAWRLAPERRPEAATAQTTVPEAHPTIPAGAPAWFAAVAARPPLPLPEGVEWGSGPGEYLHARSQQVLVWIPSGRLLMGSESGDVDERPPHPVQLRGFFLGKYETSWAQWLAFCQAERRPEPDRRPRPGAPRAPLDHPANFVSWADAQLYCRWAGLRLPSEAEWEWAARGPGGALWPWGDAPPDATRLNVADRSATWRWPAEIVRQGAVKADWDDGHPFTAPVSAFPAGATPWGCLNMAGNVSEWTQDRYHPSYRGAPDDGSPWEEGGETKRVFRGGCHYYGVLVTRTTYRARAPADARYAEQGLRVALSHGGRGPGGTR